MSYNTLNSGSLQGLQVNETLMVSARKVAGNKIQLEFAEILENGSNSVNLLALLNASDPRFSQGGARRAWMTAAVADVYNVFGIDMSDNADWVTDSYGRETLQLNVLNPVANISGTPRNIKVQVLETTEGTEYQLANLETSAKRKGKDGEYCYHNGKHIFANTTICLDKAAHVFLPMDGSKAVTATSVITGEINN